MSDQKGAMVEFRETLEEAQQRAMASCREWPRMGFQDFMELVQVPENIHSQGPGVKRYMSRQPAWMAGNELPWDELFRNLKGPRPRHSGLGVFGGCVYAQAPLAAARAIEEEERRQTAATGLVKPVPGIHSIQGIFTVPGLGDRPFVFDVTNIISGRSFFGRQVNVRQPKQPSSNPAGPFPDSDAELPLGDICFSCITTFKRPAEGVDDVQSPISAQKRYANILSQRAPDEWEPAPQSDIDIITSLFKDFKGHGGFPLLDMHKVDMSEYNSDKEVPDRIQLMLYRPMKPIPKDDVNGHIVCHAFEADRNGLIMLGNHMGYGFNMDKAASLSYSFYVHTNPDEAVMDGDGWWIQEINWPRVSANRCMMESKIWSPEGKHVASAYQDGMLVPAKEPMEVKESKL
ncbi:acyl-CoA thioesterase [Metarhizium brunneum]